MNNSHKKLNKSDNSDISSGKVLSDENKIGTKLCFQSSEAYKLLRTNIRFSLADEKECKVIGFTSSIPSEGKSLTTVNTAYSFAADGKKVLLVDCDFRKPSISKKLNIKATKGITDLLISNASEISEYIIKYQFPETQLSIDVALTGYIPPNPSELLGSGRMVKFVELCSEYYDYILLDLPPVTIVSDALVVSKFIDGLVLVVKQDYSNQKILADAIRQIKFANVKILGFVLNCYNNHEEKYYSKYSKNSKAKYYGHYQREK